MVYFCYQLSVTAVCRWQRRFVILAPSINVHTYLLTYLRIRRRLTRIWQNSEGMRDTQHRRETDTQQYKPKDLAGIQRTHHSAPDWILQCESKKSHLAACGFLTFFHKRLKIINQFFTHLLHVPIYARLQIFIQLSPTLTKLCHITHDCLVHIICSKCPVVHHRPKRTRSDVCESRW